MTDSIWTAVHPPPGEDGDDDEVYIMSGEPLSAYDRLSPLAQELFDVIREATSLSPEETENAE